MIVPSEKLPVSVRASRSGRGRSYDANPVVQDFVRCCLDNKPPA